MCTNSRYIYNRYSRQSVLVRCGKCDACKQEKALARTRRIRSHQRNGFICLFVTLTYTNDYVPYFYLKDYFNPDSYNFPIFRRCTGRYVYNPHNNKLSFKKVDEITCVDLCDCPSELRTNSALRNLKPLNGMKDCYGFIYYADVQNFFKRLRINFERDYDKKAVFDFFCVGEYGGCSYRPHFHILLFIPYSDEEAFRRTIVKSWPYADKRRTAKFIEIARDAASYVSSYVNSHASLSTCLSSPSFRQKHSFSQNLGVVLDCFGLPEILEKIESRDLHYYREQKINGSSVLGSMLIPEYVVNRYFPKFKGLGWLSSSALRSVLIKPSKLFDFYGDYEELIFMRWFTPMHYNDDGVCDQVRQTDAQVTFCHKSCIENPLYKFSRSEVYSIVLRLTNAQLYFMSVTGLNEYDYAIYYEKIWALYHSTLIKDSLLDITNESEWYEFYFNNNDVIHGIVSCPTLDASILVASYNDFKTTIAKTQNLEHCYLLKDKTKFINNYAMSNMGYNV